MQLSRSLIERASAFLEGKVRKTPLEYSPVLSNLLEIPVYLKLECLQITGSFKIRGALFYLSTLTQEEKKRGVAACSAGNHGLGLAYAAREENIPCTIFVPKSVDQAKYEKILQLGAKVIKSQFAGYDDTLEWAEEQAEKQNLHMVTPFDDERIMAGNGGSLCHEIFEQLPTVENFIVPIGGGGLASGLSVYAQEKKASCRIIGCQHVDSPGYARSLEKGMAITKLPAIDTVAGGVEGGIGENCFAILQDRVSDVLLLKEEEIREGFRWMIENHQYLIEPTSAVTIGGCLKGNTLNLKGPTVVILSGRNVSLSTVQKIVKP